MTVTTVSYHLNHPYCHHHNHYMSTITGHWQPPPVLTISINRYHTYYFSIIIISSLSPTSPHPLWLSTTIITVANSYYKQPLPSTHCQSPHNFLVTTINNTNQFHHWQSLSLSTTTVDHNHIHYSIIIIISFDIDITISTIIIGTMWPTPITNHFHFQHIIKHPFNWWKQIRI